MDNDTADIAVLITKDVSDKWFTTEVIVNGEVTEKGVYATKQAALRLASFEIIRLTKENNKEGNPNG